MLGFTRRWTTVYALNTSCAALYKDEFVYLSGRIFILISVGFFNDLVVGGR